MFRAVAFTLIVSLLLPLGVAARERTPEPSREAVEKTLERVERREEATPILERRVEQPTEPSAVAPVERVEPVANSTTTEYIFAGSDLVATIDGGSGSGSGTDTGFKIAGAIVESTGFSTFSTTTLGASDNSYATSFTTNPLGRISTFNLGVPSDATVKGIQVTLEGKRNSGTIAVPISLSWNNGTTFTSTKSNTLTTTEQVFTYGTSSTDTWGRTWTPTELSDANFQVKIDPAGSTFTVSYDHVQVKVYYTTPGGSASSTVNYVHADHLGSTNVVSNDQMAAVQVLDYYPFGDHRINSGSQVSDRQFIGERYDASTDLNYLNACYYDGNRGQFTSQDPTHLAIGNPGAVQSLTGQNFKQYLSDPQQLNSYSYAKNNPIVNKDPTGNNPFVIAGVVGATLAVGQQAYMDVYNRQFSGFKVYGTQAVIGGATGVGVAVAAVSAPFTATGIGFLGAYSSSVYGDAYNPANATGEIDQTKAVAQGFMSVATMGLGKMIPGIPGPYPKLSTLVNNFPQNPITSSANFFFSRHAQRDVLQQLSNTLGALLVELNRLQDNKKSGSKDAAPPSQSQKKTANRRRRKSVGETAYDPNKKWIWQTFAFMLILPAFALMLTPRSDPMFYALLFSIVMIIVIFTTLLKLGSLYLKDGILAQEDLFGNRLLKVSDIEQIEIVRHGFWGGTYITTKDSKININHSLFDEETHADLIEDLKRLNPAIRMKGQ